MPKTYNIMVKRLPEAVVKQLLREGKEHGLTQQQLILRKLETPYMQSEHDKLQALVAKYPFLARLLG